jgi:hypothetical protein
MLPLEDIRAHLGRITYRPGWTFEAYEDEHEGYKLRILAPVENSYRPGETVDLGIDSFLPPLETTHELETWLAWRLRRIESHESREWLRRDGQLISDPHAHENAA